MKTTMKVMSVTSGMATGATRIHVSDVTGVDFKPAKSWVGQGQGFLGFLIPGMTQRVTHSGGAGGRLSTSQIRQHDSNYVTFFPDHQAAFERVRDAVERARIAARHPAPVAAPTPPSPQATSPSSVADELKKLAQLKDDGILTQEEFDAQKAKLLG
jgi:hypothetical protein